MYCEKSFERKSLYDLSNENVAIRDLMREMIKRIAQEIYQKKGCSCGKELDDWLKAEKEVREHFSNVF